MTLEVGQVREWLTELNSFPREYRGAVRAVIAAVSADGAKPNEYFAIITPSKKGVLNFYLKHESHPADDSMTLGDTCAQCRMTSYDPATGKVSRFLAIK